MSSCPFSTKTLETINATAPAVAGNVDKIVGVFYPTMFGKHPEAKALFNEENQRSGQQPHALAQSVLASVAHLRDLGGIDAALRLIAHKHCAVGVQAAHYQIVHDNFLSATATVLGDAVTPEVAAAWSEVLMALAGNLIAREQALYSAAEHRSGGWAGCRPFRVTRVEAHGSVAKSITMAPATDGVDAPSWTPGQFVTVVSKESAPRHYTISSHCEFRITPKIHRASVDGAHPAGRVSSLLDRCSVGDVLMLHAPFGDFTLKDRGCAQKTTPLVFVSGGIGVTPILAIANDPVIADARRRVAHFHCSATPQEAPLAKQVASELSVCGHRNIIETMAPVLLTGGFALAECDFFVSGPIPMMQTVFRHLKANGVGSQQIHFEAFSSQPSFD
jgi:nitric oxide dioxygenase